VVSVEAQPLLPGAGGTPGGPTASLVVTLQGDRLDPSAAENPANYIVTWLGPDGLPGTADDQVISLPTSQGVVYDPGTNVDVASGTTFPTAVRQTLTFLFNQPLPAGSYEVQISSAVKTASFNPTEDSQLAPLGGFSDHPMVSLSGTGVAEGSRLQAPDLVQPAGVLGNLSVFEQGTPFLGQLHDDLGALLDRTLTQRGDDPQITPLLIDQMLGRLDPALGPAGERPARLVALWTDPVSLNLLDPEGNSIIYNLGTGQLNNRIADSFVSVAGNIAVVVLAVPLDSSGPTFTLTLANASASEHCGVVLLGQGGDLALTLTDQIRGGASVFTFGFSPSLIPFPILPQSTAAQPGPAALPSAPLVVVVTLLPGGLPRDVTLDRALEGGNVEESVPTGVAAAPAEKAVGNTLPGNPGGGQLVLVALGGDQPEISQREETDPASPGPSPANALRNLRLFRRSEDRPAAPHPEEDWPVSWPEQPAEQTDRLVWDGLSWLDRQAPTRRTATAGDVVAQKVLPIQQERVLPEPSLPEEASEAPGWSEQVRGLAEHALVLLGAVALPWSQRLPGRQRRRSLGKRSATGWWFGNRRTPTESRAPFRMTTENQR
jgi:hypothetical protein